METDVERPLSAPPRGFSEPGADEPLRDFMATYFDRDDDVTRGMVIDYLDRIVTAFRRSPAPSAGPEPPATLDVETFLAGLDSPNHSPESRRAWVALFYRDLSAASPAPSAGPEPNPDVDRVCPDCGFTAQKIGGFHITAQEAVHQGQPRPPDESYAAHAAAARSSAGPEPTRNRLASGCGCTIHGDRGEPCQNPARVCLPCERDCWGAAPQSTEPEPRQWPSRDQFEQMTPAEVNAYFASVGVAWRVAEPEPRPPLEVDGTLDDPTFRLAVDAAFAAPGEFGPGKGYYGASTGHFLDMVRSEYALLRSEPRPASEEKRNA